jgi:excisionase family DNA binding protein
MAPGFSGWSRHPEDVPHARPRIHTCPTSIVTRHYPFDRLSRYYTYIPYGRSPFDVRCRRLRISRTRAGMMSVDEAAQLLGISPSAVRKRIARGQLDARKVEGRWQIMLDTDLVENATELVNERGAAGRPGLTREQLEAIRDEWLQPLLLQMRSQAEQVGRLEARYRVVEQERDRLRIECESLRAQLEALPDPEPPPAPTAFATLMNMAGQLRSAEGAVVAGIALALGLWIGVGVLTWVVMG